MYKIYEPLEGGSRRSDFVTHIGTNFATIRGLSAGVFEAVLRLAAPATHIGTNRGVVGRCQIQSADFVTHIGTSYGPINYCQVPSVAGFGVKA